MHENIKRLRKRAGYTQVQLAEHMAVGQNTVSMWETGCAKPSVDKLPQLARILGCTIDELYGDAPSVTAERERSAPASPLL